MKFGGRRWLLAAALTVASAQTGNELALPKNYREWIFLSAGLGMTYGPAAQAVGHAPAFENVFVSPDSYRAFIESGKWPENTTFVLEIRQAATEGSINKAGSFQKEIVAVEAEQKRNGKWSFYGFGKSGTTAKPLPQTAACYDCHATKGATDNTFVQFYPTLLEIARRKGTLTPSYLGTEHSH
jgi:hypothetical protein